MNPDQGVNQANAVRANNAARSFPSIVGDKGGLYPRWPYMASLIWMPFLFIGFSIETYYTYTNQVCHFGSALCNLDKLPIYIPVIMIPILFALTWLLCFLFGFGSLEVNLTKTEIDEYSLPMPLNPILNFLWRITQFESIFWPYIFLTALCTFIAIYERNLLARIPIVFVFIGITLINAFCLILWFFRRRRRSQRTQEELIADLANTPNEYSNWNLSGPAYLFRTLPIIRYLFPPRPRQGAVNAGNNNIRNNPLGEPNNPEMI